MSKFHTTVSRRDFMKGLGIAGAGVGVASLSTPSFHDMDDVMSAATAEIKHPWYVKQLDFEKPTVEIDWSIFERFDRTRKFTSRKFREGQGDVSVKYMQDLFPDYTGPSVRDTALSGASAASSKGRVSPKFDGSMEGVTIPPPDVKWNTTPEDNLRTLRSAFRFFGASDVAIVELTANTRKLIYKNNGKKPYNFKDADIPEETSTEFIIPNKARFVVFFSTLEATKQAMQAPAPTWSGYDHYNRVTNRVHYFLGALGYQHIEAGGICTSNSFAALSGVAEHSRAGHIATSYKYGNMLRGMHRIITDMDLMPTHPIDAGIAKFCETCKTCAERCPYDCMDMGEKAWTHWDAEAESTQNYVPGFKGWRTNVIYCQFCKNCHAQCPFNAADDAIVHEFVRATSAITPVFDGFFASMHKSFGYGTRNPNDWWETDVPTGRWDPAFIKA